MSNIRKISVIALTLLLIGIIGSIFTIKPMLNKSPISKEEVINDKFNKIKIVTDNTGIELLPTTDATAKVDLSGKAGKGTKYHLSADVENATLTISVKYNLQSLVTLFPSSPLLLKVYVPEVLYESLQIEDNNGHVNVGDFQAKEIHINTNNGRVVLNNVKSTKVTTETDNGSSNLKNVKASDITVKSKNGKIILEDIDGQIYAKSNNGSISFVTNQLDQPIDFETNNGRINIQTKEKPINATINANVNNGKADIFDSSNRHVVFGNGENSINLTTSNGSITIEKK